MSNKGFGERIDGRVWWDVPTKRKKTLEGFEAARAAFQTRRYFLEETQTQEPTPAEGARGLQRAFCRHWQSRWVKSYTSDASVGPVAKAEIRKRQGAAFEKRNTRMIRKRLGQAFDGLTAGETFELNRDFARPFSFMTAADLLGLDLEPDLCHRAAEAGDLQIAQESAPEDKYPSYRALQSLHRAITTCLDTGGVADGGLMAWLLDLEQARNLDRDFSVMSAANLLAGSVTLGTALAICLDQILKSPALLQCREADLPQLIDEILRLAPPARNVRLMGQSAEEGTPELLSFNVARANRDPAVFSCPHEISFDRPPHQHLSFGSGAHICDGVKLVRLSLKLAIPEIIQRAQGLKVWEVEKMIFHARFTDLTPSEMT
ncbi:cytochrome P450 [Rhodobacteraceae bacterium N5(2021)]|uniref:Cytochrome P450 n=1 Tax=Gymnodinialimonas phycosphaerae TaxID=2841589 RepID=A0A975TUV1_9RHOB|nr:cytochrome P450 [Gymnodinialimonas phycosphaerae]MBY4895275.1 cytochrome P450 [Gymnodinialimonas phycosphaerae]